MNDKTYHKLLAAVIVTGIVSTVILLVITGVLYRNCSILSYIANGR